MRCARAACARQASLVTRNLRSISMPINKKPSLLAHSAVEQCDGFDVCRMRKHVHYSSAFQLESVLVDEDARIARKRRWMAGHIDDPARGFARQVFQHRVGA